MKFWCNLGIERCQVTIENCKACDQRAGLPKDSHEYCTGRSDYVMQIQEWFHHSIWYLKTLWETPKGFCAFLAKDIANRIGIEVTPMGDRDGWHLIWGHLRR